MTIEKLRPPPRGPGREEDSSSHDAAAPPGTESCALLDALPHPVIELAPDGRTVKGFNRLARERAPDPIAGRGLGAHWLQWFHPEDRAALAEASTADPRAGRVPGTPWRHVARVGFGSDARRVIVAGRIAGGDGTSSDYLTLTDVEDLGLGEPARAHGQRNDRFLMALEEELRALGAGVDVRRIAARRLAEYLSVDRCTYALMDGHSDDFEVDQDYTRTGVPSAVGRYALSGFGAAATEALRRGRHFVVEDAEVDDRLEPATRAAYRDLGVRALIGVPLHRAGRLVAAMAVHHGAPRRWRRDEIALVHAVSHRCWESLERARAEFERRAGDARFRALVEGAAQIVWSTDASGRVVEPLPSWCAFTGQDAAQAMGDGWLDAVHPDDRERVRRVWRQGIEGGRAFEGEFRVQHADGGWRWMQSRGHAVVGEDGRIREWIGMNVDVSERKRIERRDAFLVRLDDAVRSLSDPEEVAASLVRLLGEYLLAQRVTYLERDPDEPVFTVVRDHAPGLPVLHGRTFRLDEFGSGAGEALQGGRGFLSPEPGVALGPELVGAPGSGPGDANRSAVLVVPLFRSRRLAAVVGLVRLMPRQWQEEEVDLARAVIHRGWESIERARLARDLRVADERKNEFIAMLAHELRNPLAPLRNGLQVLRRSPHALPAERVHQMMERQVDQLVRLVDDLLDVSRITRGKMELRMEPQSLAKVLGVALETARPLIEAARHRLDVDLPPGEVRVRGDAVRLAQVFANLLNNAARYTDAGGSIVLAVRVEGGRAIVSVRDSGIGLAPEMRERVFETFQQVARGPNDVNSGLGIGLSLARSLTLLHGGSITVHSQGLGHGCEFVVSLPLIADGEGARSAPADPGPGAEARVRRPTAGLRIVVVDDNEDAADAFGALLKLLGADVRVCYRALDAVAEIERSAPEIAFLDLGMPEISGYELARRVRQLPGGAATCLVALTGWGQDSDRQRSRDAGFDHHLVKPVTLEVLESVLATTTPVSRH